MNSAGKKGNATLALMAAATAGMVVVMNETLQIVGITIGAIGLFVAIINIFVKPAWRSWRLRAPCEVHFTILPLQDVRLDYVLQDDQGHHLKEIVLPAASDVEIEIEYVPKIAFEEKEISFGCPGEDKEKPYATEIIRRLITIGKNNWIPGEDENCWRDRHGFIHFVGNKRRQKRARIPIGFKMKTGRAGVYLANMFFFTEEKPGKAALTIRVEDMPRTPMRCIAHWGCRVTPVIPTKTNDDRPLLHGTELHGTDGADPAPS
jgi:hypothetical protein